MAARTLLFASIIAFVSIQSSKLTYAWAQPSQGPVLINAGGDSYVDSMGNVWETDAKFTTEESYHDVSPIAGTRDEPLYQSHRFGGSQYPALKYEIPVENGLYDVHMHFAEVNPELMAVGARLFDVLLEGSVVLHDLDVYSEAGHHNALTKVAPTVVNDGSLSIQFTHEGAMISAIEIIPSSATSRKLQQASLPVYINAGGNDFVDTSGRTWMKDVYYNSGGKVEPTSVKDIRRTEDDELYQTGRYDTRKDPRLEYTIPVPNGDYEVSLHFAETYDAVTTVGQRVFNVFMEGKKVFRRLDIFREAGGYSALVKKRIVTVSDGALSIKFGKVVQNAKISAIEIHRVSTTSTSSPVTTAPTTDAIYRINMGAVQKYVDSSGNTWSADKFYNQGGQVEKWSGGSKDILKTSDDDLYRIGRYDPRTEPELKYDLPVENGEYLVVMHFAETYSEIKTAGQRLFDVFIEGQEVLTRFDILADSGGAYTAVKKSAFVKVNDGKLTVTFGRIEENPKLNALEVYSTKSSTPPSSSSASIFPLYINAGGKAFTDTTGISWMEDTYFRGGEVEKLKNLPNIISGATDSTIYRTGRYDPPTGPSLRYDIPCPNGDYSLIFHFSELYKGAFQKGARLFDVKIEGKLVMDDVDIFLEAGGSYSALVRTVSTTVNDGVLSIEFVHGIENPKISAIEVHQGKSASVPTSSPSELSSQDIYINAGSDEPYTNGGGITWMADKYFSSGSKVEPLAVGEVSATTDDGLFRTGRYDPPGGKPLTYNIPVANNGNYDVTLYFAETYDPAMKPGIRQFDITINGSKKFSKVDIFKETNSGYKALKKSATVSVTNKLVTIQFGHLTQNPKINAISVTTSSSNPPTNIPTASETQTNTGSTSLPIRINSGGPALIDNAGNQWSADVFYTGSGLVEKLWNPVTTIYGTADDQLYMTARYDDSRSHPTLNYEIPVPNGIDLEVTLHFAELWSKAMYKGARTFSVKVENQIAFPSVDIYSEVGAFTALKKKVDAKVTDGRLSIEFAHIVENPKISAIEINEKNTQTVSSQLAAGPIPSNYMINVGGGDYKDSSGRTWQADKFFNDGGQVETISNAVSAISGTIDDELYRTARFVPGTGGPGLKYEIPVPDGDYAVTFHFAEIWKGAFKNGARVFDVLLEGSPVIQDLDIFESVGEFAAMTKTEYASVNDGFLTVEFGHKVENPKLSALDIRSAVIPTGRNSHRAHAVPGGPYVQTDVDGDGYETIKVDGTFSHTHTAGSEVMSFKWKVDDKVVGSGMITNIRLPVGVHSLILEVIDSDRDFSSDYTTVTVKPKGFPDISSISPPGGDVTGGNKVVIKGSGFASSADKTKVRFGSTTLTGSAQITVISESTIEVKNVPAGVMGPAVVTVDTEVGASNKAYYVYSDKTLPPVSFNSGVTIKGIYGPTTLAFDPMGNLHVGTQGGSIIKAELDENYQVIESSMIVSDVIADSSPGFRSILGIVFDPMDKCDPVCTVYVSHSSLFHGQVVSYNGKVSAVSGAELDKLEHVITGLPVSDHDHGINGMVFGDNGDLYIQVGGNTNAGVPGAVSSTGKQKEGVLSAATVVAHVSRPGFNGNLEYGDKGDISSGANDVEVFASGQRNSFDITLHSNGNLYASENGPNNKYGKKSVDCNSQTSDPHEGDELNLIEKGNYYGHANRKRGEKDPRQCKWRSALEESDADYTAPMLMLPASSNGIVEFQTRHFGGQLRGQLLIGRYKGALYHVALSNDGRAVVGELQVLTEAGGLDVTQGPDGTVFVAQNTQGQVVFHSPNEPDLGKLHVTSVFPRRGPKEGGSILTLFGEKFESNPSVTVGGKNCAVQSNNGNKMTCKLPSGSGKADVVVKSGGETDTFSEAYRYISGKP